MRIYPQRCDELVTNFPGVVNKDNFWRWNTLGKEDGGRRKKSSANPDLARSAGSTPVVAVAPARLHSAL